ncbi:MAG: hypothetical protein ACRD52_19435 [Candidatus Acidiferrales bacterium]
MRNRFLWPCLFMSSVLCLYSSPLLGQTPPSAKSPCLDPQGHPEFHQLDFWAGTWEVFNKDKKLSDTTIEKVLNGCGLAETWTATGAGNNGLGMSSYDALTKKWEYFWVAENGYMSHWEGSLIDNEMRFVREQPDPKGGMRLRHWSLFNLPDGKIRELSLSSSDGGKTWTTEYDFTWVRKK